jgi:hypothetical protein
VRRNFEHPEDDDSTIFNVAVACYTGKIPLINTGDFVGKIHAYALTPV